MQGHGWRYLKYKTQRCFNPSLLSEGRLFFFIVIPFHMWTFSCNLTLSGRPSYKWVYSCSKMELVFIKRGAHSWHIKNADGFVQFIRFSRGRYIVVYSKYSPSCYNLERVDFSELRHNVIFFMNSSFMKPKMAWRREKKWVCRKERWGTCFIFLFGKGKPARFFGILSP